MPRRLALLGCVCAMSALLLPAQEKKGKKYALLVGVTEYDHSRLSKLRFTENDVEEVAKLLRSKACGFDEVRVLSTTAGKKNPDDAPTAKNIREAIDALVRRKGDTILIGLSGHGVQLEVKDPDEKGKPKAYPYFCPADAGFFDVSYSTGKSASLVLLDDLFAKVGKCGAKNRLVLIDACRNEVDAESSTRNVDVDRVTVPRGVGVLFSCKSGEKAWESAKLGRGHGVFFYHVVQGLKGKAKNEYDEVTWDSLASYVRTGTHRLTPKVIGGGAEQTPHGILNLDSLAVLATIEKGEAEKTPVVKDDPGKEPVVKDAPETITNSIGMKLAYIKEGSFLMGSPADEKDRSADEKQHEVRISKAFHLGVYAVTQKQFEKVMGYNPSYFSKDGTKRDGDAKYYDWSKPAGGAAKVAGMDTDDFPVENVSYEEAVEFCKKLSGREKEKKRLYRLPTEAEWEYSCRGGAGSKPTPFHYGDSLSSEQANFDGNHPYGGATKGPYLERTCKVGSYKPNKLGLYDMHGNVWQWCADWYGEKYYADSPAADPAGPSEGSYRVIRGGSWCYFGRYCRSAHRVGGSPTRRDWFYGFRVALVPSR